MKKYLKYIIGLFIPLAFLVGCEDETYEFGDLASPENFSVTINVVGANGDDGGDGSGIVNISAQAQGAITYQFEVDGSIITSATGEATFQMSKTGKFDYVFAITAFGRGGSSSTHSETRAVFVAYEPPPEVVELLTNGSQRTWRIAKEIQGHFPNEKEGRGAYDDRMIFHADGTFEYITNGGIWGKAEAMDPELGVGGQDIIEFGEYFNYPWPDFTDSWSFSEPEGKLSLGFDGVGFVGFYVGSNPDGEHRYEVINIDYENKTMQFWIIAAEGNAWYTTLIADE
jgi:hypothetical protein